MTNITRQIVLFADLRGSTALYEELGNEQATAMVTRTISALSQRVPTTGGRLIKTLGDGLMATFTDVRSAVMAAIQMHEALQQEIAWAPTGQAPQARLGVHLQLQVAIAAGEMVEVDGDFFGDAVNIAARLLDHAGDDETLVTRDVYEELPWEVRARFRHLNKLNLRGRTAQVDVYLLGSATADAAQTQLETDLGLSGPRGVRLVWEGQFGEFERERFPIIIGRGRTCTVKLTDTRVSRAHARIDLIGNAVQLTDLSINGTYVRFVGDSEPISLRRGPCTLHGSGSIGLGGDPENARIPSLGFAILSN